MEMNGDRQGDVDDSPLGRKRRMTPILRFTPTESKVLHGVQHGQSNKQIAFDLGIAEATVKAHMTVLMRKLNVCNRTQAALVSRMFSDGASLMFPAASRA